MTNYEKIKNIEISGARLFEHKRKDEILEILRDMECEDCPVSDVCDDVRMCGDFLLDWLSQEADE